MASKRWTILRYWHLQLSAPFALNICFDSNCSDNNYHTIAIIRAINIAVICQSICIRTEYIERRYNTIIRMQLMQSTIDVRPANCTTSRDICEIGLKIKAFFFLHVISVAVVVFVWLKCDLSPKSRECQFSLAKLDPLK